MSFRKLPHVLMALGVGLLSAAPAVAQPAMQRTPTIEGPWTAPVGMLYFDFLHRFNVGPAPAHPVSNVPNFHLSSGVADWLALGVQYATETMTVPGASQELEVFAKQTVLDQAGGAPVSLGVKEAFNTTAWSPDAELSLRRDFGAMSLLGALRGMGNFRYSGSPQAALAVGGAYALTPFLSLTADVASVPFATGAGVVWGAGTQIQIPATPHTLSLHATNAGTDSIQGSSVDTGSVRYGFAFSVPFSNGEQWLRIVQAPKAKASDAPEKPAASRFKPAAFFGSSCASCHGAEGQGGFGPDLRNVEKKGDDFIATRIREGSPKGMPAFQDQLSEAELESLVAYVKSL